MWSSLVHDQYRCACAGTSRNQAGGWEALCPDVRRFILRKLPLRDLAVSALTCMEFSRAAEERARLVADGEHTYGKRMFRGFMSTFQELLHRWIFHTGVACPTGLIIRATGKAELVTDRQATRMRFAEDTLCRVEDSNRYCFAAQLWRRLPGERKIADVDIKVRRNREGPVTHLKVLVNQPAGKAAMGLLSAICADMTAGLHRPFSTTTICFTGMWGAAGKREAED
jgi:hypothetical protein